MIRIEHKLYRLLPKLYHATFHFPISLGGSNAAQFVQVVYFYKASCYTGTRQKRLFMGADSCFLLDSDNLSVDDSLCDNPNEIECFEIPDRINDIIVSEVSFSIHNSPNLSSIVIPNNVCHVTFNISNCRKLKKIVIPASINKIDFRVNKDSCENLETIEINPGNTFFSSDENCVYDYDRSVLLFVLPTAEGNLCLPGSVKKIKEDAFQFCKRLKEISFTGDVRWWHPSSIKDLTSNSIPPDAFIGCQSVLKIAIPITTKGIESGAFKGCSSLDSIYLPDSICRIEYDCFEDCHKLKTINVSDNNEKFSSLDGVLYNKNKDKLLFVPPASPTIKNGNYLFSRNIQKISEFAFFDCVSLSSIDVDKNNSYFTSSDGCLFSKDGKNLLVVPPNHTFHNNSYVVPLSVSKICGHAFSKNEKLKKVSIQQKIFLNKASFYSCGNLEEITLKEGIIPSNLDPDDSPFVNCSSLRFCLIVSSGTKTIPFHAFRKCKNIERVVIPHSVTTIEDAAFAGCSNLVEIQLSSGLTTIEDGAFFGCNSLKKILIPETVKEINYGAFDCDSLERIDVSPCNESYCSVDGVLFTKDIKRLIIYPRGKRDITYDIPDNVDGLDAESFSSNLFLESVNVNNTNYIGSFCFAKSKKLKEIRIPSTVDTVDQGAFSQCNLELVEIDSQSVVDNILTVFDDSDCSKLVLTDKISRISKEGFKGARIKNIVFKGQNVFIEESAFEGCPFSEFNFPKHTEIIEKKVLADCKNLIRITIPPNVKKIRFGAFMGCSNLNEIVFQGTRDQWEKIIKEFPWRWDVPTDCRIRICDGITETTII